MMTSCTIRLAIVGQAEATILLTVLGTVKASRQTLSIFQALFISKALFPFAKVSLSETKDSGVCSCGAIAYIWKCSEYPPSGRYSLITSGRTYSIIRMLFFGRSACEAGGGVAGSGHRSPVQLERKTRKLLGPLCYCSLHPRTLPGQLKAHLGNHQLSRDRKAREATAVDLLEGG